VTVVVQAAPPGSAQAGVNQDSARELARSLLNEGAAPSRAARELARRLDMPRNLAYQIVQEAKEA
jgi:hypothetical protein